MKSSSMIRSLPLVLLGILGAGLSSGCDGRQDGEGTSTDSVSKTAPATGADEKEKATMRLQLSLGNDTATPDSVKKELALGADPRWVGDLGDNLLVKAVNIKQNYKISDIDIDPSDKAKMELSIINVTGDATWMPPKDPENIAKICEILIKAGAEVNHAGKLGGTPLTACMRYCQVPTIKVLLAAGADPNQADKVPGGTPNSPLGVAVSSQCPEAILLLLKAGAKIDRKEIIYREFKKLGPLMETARNDSPKLEGTSALAALEKAAGDADKATDSGN